MIIGERLKEIREHKNLSQGDIEKRTGLLRCYISRVENGHTVPAVETLEKLARAFDMPLYQLLYDCDQPPAPAVGGGSGADSWGNSGKDARYLRKLSGLLSRMESGDRKLLLFMAAKMAHGKKGAKAS
jgi:transcriptional regulator with XRE-family HTH domain